MIESYLVLAGRIRKELDDLERLISKANRAIATARHNPRDSLVIYATSGKVIFTLH